jgi:hypothetical protein
MPVIKSSYKPSRIFRSSFISTIYSGIIRRLEISQSRERITLQDDDFIDLDWSYSSSSTKSVAVILHGMEGNGQRPYVSGIARHLNTKGIDAVCVNFRGCSGENNKKYFSFHSGQTEDLKDIITHITSKHDYESIFLNGISLGGNIVLKYLGETSDIPIKIKAAMAVSVPLDLTGSSRTLHEFKNILYHIYFMIGLKFKLKRKHKQFPHKISRHTLWRIWTLRKLDELYTSTANGFKDATDYYTKCSSLQFLPQIKTPVLILNAINDSFLTESCYPVKIANENKFISLEMPRHGGHVGFTLPRGVYYNELRAGEFFLKFK